MIVLHVLVFLAGLSLVFLTLVSSIRTFVLPRSAYDRLTRSLFRFMRRLFEWRLRLHGTPSYADLDRVMALFAPVSLLLLLAVWLLLILAGYMGMFWAIGALSTEAAFSVSGSSLFTLGFASITNLQTTVLAFSEAMIGLIQVALLISYLPTMYQAFARREFEVTRLEVRAGSPPSAVYLLRMYHRLGHFDKLQDIWTTWEAWFADVQESHTSLAALAFFRSPQPQRCWVTAAGAVLDAASLVASTVDQERDPQVELCIRAGFVTLRHIADYFRISFKADVSADDPISVSRAEYDVAYDALKAEGIPVKPNRDQAWRDFAGWRVNYDTVLLALCTLTMAPKAPWSSDRTSIWWVTGRRDRR